ncbi:MAG TPA: pyrroline-5-carboxylate reductase [Rhodanobacteraceae bacterium]|nr:pyrroline-5-carboxylate reductase [Rhodanobacteraceae bacterium]
MTHPAPRSPGAARTAFIGGGNMARSLIGALLRGAASPDAIAVAEPDAALREALERDFGVAVHAGNSDAARDAGTIVLAVKPQVMQTVCTGLAPIVADRLPLVISIAAGIRLDQLQHWLGTELPMVRAMPNTPALIGAGISGLIANAKADADQRARAEAILAAAGRTVWIEREELMDTVTAVSGSGPAYFFLLVEALEDAAVAQGLPRATARSLATLTCLGAGRMLTEGAGTPAELRKRVTSPGGTTQAALDTFADAGFPNTVARAVEAATARGRELSDRLS